ncbi:hypothetical protein B0T18DRAFT_394018 [Schizothecium vesticola]|uniref:Uncharacterized protein n=1 Tax=Schizothecium vesticola TaxID=314040 RepID=A0AA40K0G9_9PEZI|nr:hypothetical protein B0T18DRAFT_394018 [Schizothecium vesticola]
MQAYVDLHSKLPKRSAQLVDLFGWAGLSGSGDLIDQINKVTLWDESKSRAFLTSVDALAAPNFKNKQTKLTTLTDKALKKLDVQADTIKKALEVGYSCDALVAYLVVKPSLVTTGTITVTDADSLFEYAHTQWPVAQYKERDMKGQDWARK